MKYTVSFEVEFRRNPFNGLYVAIEGIDGSGKSTQVHKIAEYLKKKGKEIVLTSEPKSDGLVGSIVRDVLAGKIKIPSAALQYLYTADRVINHKEVVEPALSQSKVVLSHRCFWSAVPYGVMDQTGDTYNINEAHQIMIAQGILSMYHRFIAPDLTFYLTISPDTAMERLSKMEKHKEIYEKKEKLTKISKGYDWLIREFPSEFTIIDGERTEDEITTELIQKIEEYESQRQTNR